MFLNRYPLSPGQIHLHLSRRNRRRLLAIVVSAAVALVLVAGVGAYAGYQFLFGGAQPAERLPASLLAYASVDLKPGLDQQRKLQNLVGKFPKAGTKGDNAQDVVDTLLKKLDIEDVDAEKDLASWVGPRASAGLWLHKDEPFGLVAVSATDDKAASEALTRLMAKVKGVSVSFIVDDGVALIAVGDAGAKAAVEAADKEASEHPFTEAAPFADARDWLGDDHAGALWIDLNRAPELAKAMTSSGAERDEMLKALQGTVKTLQGTMAMGIRATDDGIEARYRTFGNKPSVAGNNDAIAKIGAQPADADVAAIVTVPDLKSNDALGKLLESQGGGADPKGSLTLAEIAELNELMNKNPDDLTVAEQERGMELFERAQAAGPGNPMAGFGRFLQALSGATLAGSGTGLRGNAAFQITAHAATAADAKTLGELEALSTLLGDVKVTTEGQSVTLSGGKASVSNGKLADNADFKSVSAGAPGQVQLAVYVNVASLMTVSEREDFGPVKAIGIFSGYEDGEAAGSIRILIG